MQRLAIAVLVMSCAPGARPAPATATAPVAPGPTSTPTATAGAEASPAAKARPAAIRVVATGFRNEKGHALIALYAGPNGFPNDAGAARARKAVAIEGGTATVSFGKLAPGNYAVAVLHDENQNYEMDTGAFGRPKEGYGASNDARGRFGPPDWDDAVFTVAAGARSKQAIRLDYP